MEKVIGTVIKGSQNGRKYDFPTANIKWKKLPKNIGSELYWAMTIVDTYLYHVVAWHVSKAILECHLLDFDGDLYDKELEIVLIEKLPIPKPPEGQKFKPKERYTAFKDLVRNQIRFD